MHFTAFLVEFKPAKMKGGKYDEARCSVWTAMQILFGIYKSSEVSFEKSFEK